MVHIPGEFGFLASPGQAGHMGRLAPIDSQVIVVNEHTPIRQGKTEGYHSVYGALGLFPQPHRKGRSASGPIDLFLFILLIVRP
jgi:hypothetical protein